MIVGVALSSVAYFQHKSNYLLMKMARQWQHLALWKSVGKLYSSLLALFELTAGAGP